MATPTKVNQDWEKMRINFWLYWGLAPQGTPKYKAGVKALDFIYREFFSTPLPTKIIKSKKK